MTPVSRAWLSAAGALVLVGLLVWAAGASHTIAILAAFTAVVAVGLFLVPKVALATIAVFLVVQPVLVNMVGGATTPLGLALHRLHQAFAVAAFVRVALFLWWDRVAAKLRRWLWLTAAFLGAGLGSAVAAQVPLQTMALGAFLAVKFPLFLLLALTISWSERDCQRLIRVMLWLGPLLLASGLLVGLVPIESQSVFIDPTDVESTYVRGGLSAMHGIFSHPGVFGWATALTGCYAVAALLTGRPGWRLAGGGSLVASVLGILGSLRRKPLVALPVAAVYGVMRFAVGRRRWGVLAVFLLVAGGASWIVAERLAAEYRDAQLYVDPYGPTAPRTLLYITGVQIANSRFPLGAGFGRFGGYVSSLDYSPLYDEYGLSHVYGLSPEDPDYIEDTYWPHIAAETGWVGAAILILFFLLLLERATRAARRAADQATKAVAIGAALALLEALVESVAGPVFEVSLFAFAIAVPLGVALARLGEAAPPGMDLLIPAMAHGQE